MYNELTINQESQTEKFSEGNNHIDYYNQTNSKGELNVDSQCRWHSFWRSIINNPNGKKEPGSLRAMKIMHMNL